MTTRQLGLLFGISKSATDRMIDHFGPALALWPRRRFAKGTVVIVDGTLGARRPMGALTRRQQVVVQRPPP